MKLICPQCKEPIPPAGVNMAQGVCYCETCNSIFKLSTFLTEESPLPLVEKPPASKVESFVDGSSVGFILPRGNRGVGFFFLFFALLWNGITWTVFSLALRDGETIPVLFLIPFILAGLGTAAAAVFLLFSQTSVLVDRESVRVSWDLFGKSFTRKRPAQDMHKIHKVEIYRQNNKPVHGVGIDFKGAKTLKFGSQLTEPEKDWIISELDRFRRENVAGNG